MRTSVLLATMLLAKELLQLHETGVVLDFKEEWSRAPARFHQSYSWLVCYLRNVPSKIRASYCGHADDRAELPATLLQPGKMCTPRITAYRG